MSNDLGLAIIRVALGLMLVAHGSNKVWGAGGLAGTEGWFAGLGLQPARLHARLAAATELTAGVLMAAGFLTALAAAAFVGLMLVATLTDHRGKGFFVFKGGWEYAVLVAAVAIGIAAAGPGDWSVDALLDLHVSGAEWALGAAVAGAVAAAGLLATCFRPVPTEV
jgi:putative oxidoreductase